MKKFTLFSSILLCFTLNAQIATAKTYESYIKTTASKIEFLGAYPGGQMGASMSVGDINDDGIDDFVAASPFSSVSNRKWNGSISLLISERAQFANRIDLYGDYSGDQLGTNLTVADFDGDGIADVAVSAYMAKNNVNDPANKVGKVYVLYGKKFLTSQTAGQNLHGVDIGKVADLVMTGNSAGDLFGLTLQNGDVNADGISDLIVGAPMSTQKNVSGLGAVYVYFGSKDGLPKDHNLLFIGKNVAEKFGATIELGNLNGDDNVDMIIAAPQAHVDESSQAGRVYVYYNVADGRRTIEESDLTLNGSAERQWFGFSMDTGRLDDDNYDDLIISSFPFYGDAVDAKLSVFSGYGLSKKNIEQEISIFNTMDSKLLGSKVLLNDLNGDGIDDILIGAPGISKSESSESGDLYIIYSGTNGYEKTYSIKDFEMNSLIHGEKPDDWFAYNFDVLDYNNDGYKDLVISARYTDSPQGVNNGKVYVLAGNERPFGQIKTTIDRTNKNVNRGKLVQSIVNNFDLRSEKAVDIKSCREHIEFCLFNFMAMSSFDEIQLEPELVLYPDVTKDNQFYDDISIATMLGLVTGYINEEGSPFHPERPVTRVQALKTILGAAGMVPAKYQFELIAMLGSYDDLFKQFSYFKDVNSSLSHMWWYPRYVNFALENDIIDEGEYFRPDEAITPDELNDMMKRTLDLIDKR